VTAQKREAHTRPSAPSRPHQINWLSITISYHRETVGTANTIFLHLAVALPGVSVRLLYLPCEAQLVSSRTVTWLLTASACVAAGCSKGKAPEHGLPTSVASSIQDAGAADACVSAWYVQSAFTSSYDPCAPAPPLDASTRPTITPPAGLAATFCSELPKTQRRIFAAVWAGLEGPRLLPLSEPQAITPPPAVAAAAVHLPVADGGSHIAADAADELEEEETEETGINLNAIDAVTGVPEFPNNLGQCWGTPGGAWTMLVDNVVREQEDLLGTLAITHVDRKGRLLPVKVGLFNYTNIAGPFEEVIINDDSSGDFSVVNMSEGRDSVSGSVFDWDNDGEPEFLLYVCKKIAPFRNVCGGRVWTYRSGVVRLYWPTRELNVTSAEDIDGDGRDDIWVYVGGGTYASESDHMWHVTDSLALAAHSLPNGKFSFTDSVAIESAKKQCPKPGKTISSQVGALCARVWGMSPETIERVVERSCRRPEPGSECEYLKDFNSLAWEKIPVVIPKAERD